MPSPKNSPGVCDSLFDFGDLWRVVERALGSHVLLPGQVGESDSEDVRDAKKLAAAILRQACDDAEQALDHRDKLRPTDNPNTLHFTDLDEVWSWIMEDSVWEETPIETATPTDDEAQAFPTPLMPQTLTLERDGSGDMWSFSGCCRLLGLDARGVRKILRSWMDSRARGDYHPLIAPNRDVVKRRRALARQHQIEAMHGAQYPVRAIASAFGVKPRTIDATLRRLAPPKTLRTPRERERTASRNRQIRLWSQQSMPVPVIAHILGLNCGQIRDAMRVRSKRAIAGA